MLKSWLMAQASAALLCVALHLLSSGVELLQMLAPLVVIFAVMAFLQSLTLADVEAAGVWSRKEKDPDMSGKPGPAHRVRSQARELPGKATQKSGPIRKAEEMPQ